MAKGLSPIIGLAVVVALALAAVFGSISLANPAMAAIGQPADAELTERVDSPQDATVTIHIGETANVDITSDIRGGGENYASANALVITPTTGVVNAATPPVSAGFNSITVNLTGEGEGEARVSVPLTLQDGTTQRIRIDVTVVVATAPMAVGIIEDKVVEVRPEDVDTTTEIDESDVGEVELDVTEYFENGNGTATTSEITDYVVSVDGTGVEIAEPPATGEPDYATTDVTLTVADDEDTLLIRAADSAEEGQTSVITIAANPGDAEQVFFVDVVAMDTVDPISATVEGLPSFVADSQDPGSNTRYTVEFAIGEEVNTLIHDLVIEFHEDYSVPSAIGTSAVTITTGPYTVDDDNEVYYTFTPEDVSVDGEEIFISIGDITEDDNDGVYVVGKSDGVVTMEVVFRQAAGISNPTENGGYFLAAISFGDVVSESYDEDAEMPEGLEESVPLKISLDEEDGGLGTVVTATGKGYKNGTTLTVFLDRLETVMWDDDDDSTTDMVPLDPDDKAAYEMTDDALWLPDDDVMDSDGNLMAPSRSLDLGEDVLCVDSRIGGDDQGSCEFTVTHPTFSAGLNYVNAVDGRDNYDDSPDTFLLEQSIQASPAEGSPGEIILIQLVDFPVGQSVNRVRLGRQEFCGSNPTPTGDLVGCPAATVDSTGSANFSITIPNWARAGVQDLRVDAGGVGAGTNVTIGGPVIMSTPSEVLANQRISLIGTGFSSNAVIGDDDLIPDQPDSANDVSKISVGGEVIRRGRINGGDDVEVDSGGNWSASVDLPLAASTTADGQRVIRVTDSGGRTGVVMVTVPQRTVTITPEAGRVGTIAVIRGAGFPSKNDEGSSFNVQIVYDAGNDKETTVSAVPDASGRFEVQLRVPTTASIPSTNTVRVEFEDDENVAVVTTVAHEVPEGIINLSETSGGPGSSVTVNGEGFKSFVPIALVRVGALDVTPSPKPSTDGNGMMSFDITVPGLDVGIQTIEVSVGDTTASTGFTVTESGVNPGDIKPVAAAIEELGDNLVSVWHFNNDTKVWAFYDPTLAEGNTLTHMITGETYLIRVKSTTEVILNNDTRSLTCVGTNCWNQQVW